MNAEAKRDTQRTTSHENVRGVPLIDVVRQYRALEKEITDAIGQVCASGSFVLGPACQRFEEEMAAYCGVRHAIGCASGSDALLLALMACDIGPGHEVLLPSFTFFATASAVTRLGAKPVFVDIDPQSFNIDTTLLETAVTPATKAIIPVHLFGQCAEMETIQQIARQHNLVVIEDAAQAIGAEYRGRRAGALGDVGCLSFYPTKNLGGLGDGGMITTDRDDLADRLQILRGHGMRPRYHHQVVGINSRLDSIQAAALGVKLKHLDRWAIERRRHAELYATLFTECGLNDMLGLPTTGDSRRHVWNQYTVRVFDARRDALRQHLTDRKIGTEIYYPLPLHLQKCFTGLGEGKGSLPQTEQATQEVLALPVFPELTEAEQRRVVTEIAAFFGRTAPATKAPVRPPKFLKRHGSQAESATGS